MPGWRNVTNVAVSLGTNAGNREANLSAMLTELRRILDDPLAFSRVMETEPVDVPDSQVWFLNVIVSGNYAGNAHELLCDCRTIEHALLRKRPFKNAARTADVDILLYGRESIGSNELTVPHPQIANRRFCLEGLRRIAPGRYIAAHGQTVAELYERMPASIKQQRIIFHGMPDQSYFTME
ncbi:MAG: 2-amino-4-hydroxy-6-hydroxymethyldihydropteridine diphosphokinase [Chitinivibrionales bacterium]|nr:2-amino-4-hydroxy-6-hydroxymethyldihydropteridine diphosphokinase [Chitinivibrionales bacterium]